jgi:exopolysaccharide biosynthesis polyprenyl glycosylphosphotransferase
MDGASVRDGGRRVRRGQLDGSVTDHSRRGLRAASAPDDTPVAVRSLRWILLGLDLCAVTLAWLITLLVPGEFTQSLSGSTSRFATELAVITVSSMLVIASQRLYLARVCGVRAVETARLARASVLSGVIALVVASELATELFIPRAALGALLTFALLTLGRGVYGSWLRRGRTNGRFCRPVVLVGAGPEAVELNRLIEQHPELGYRVTGVVGPASELRGWSSKVALGGDFEDVLPVLERAHANGVIVATSDVPTDELNRMTRVLLHNDVHVHLSSGLRGIDHRRIRALPLAHEPLFYLEQQSLAPWQRWIKRVLDVSVSGVMLVLLSPVLLASAIAIKLCDRGPVFFRQTRVGRDGAPFTLLKLRTMVPDAEEQLVDLSVDNQRTGPLFKLARDPRRTRVGHTLERTSIDELPQLINVLRGEMSLVGPRPALPHEVEQFDDELLGRQDVTPGITGLWQVEGRDNPEFEVYRRLDLFYVENWSVGLDLAIMLATAQAVLGRLLELPRRRREARPPVDLTVLTGESATTS